MTPNVQQPRVSWVTIRLKQFFGWFLLLIGVVGIGTLVDKIASGTADGLGTDIAMSALFTVGAVLLLLAARRDAARARGAVADPQRMGPREIENAVLASVEKRGGRVTVTEVAADTALTFTESKKALDELARAKACETLLTPEGMLVYNFGEITQAESKWRAT